MAEQLPLTLPPRVALGARDFFVSDANRAAFEMVTGSAPWPLGKLVLAGPAGAGKSHLAQVWADQAGARIISAPGLAPDTPLPQADRIVVEDADRLPQEAQSWLFHAHNALLERGGQLLLTARSAPSRWPLTLPDLATRMAGTTLVSIDDPDDALLAAVLTKHFADRQIPLDRKVLDYITLRMDRSFAAAAALVDRLDRLSLSQKRRITVPLAAQLFDIAEDLT